MACDVCLGINSHRCPVCGHDPEMKECQDCGGKGYLSWWAVRVEDGEEIEVRESTWYCLPPTKELAVAMRQKYYQGEREMCGTCDGAGEIEVEDEGPYYDEDEYRERQYRRIYG